MTQFERIQLLAMKAVVDGNMDYYHRCILRWYSKNFNTPLHVAEELPLDEVLCAFFETRYEEMSDEERDLQITELLETPEQRKERLRKEDFESAETEEFAKFVEQEEEQEAARLKKNLTLTKEKQEEVLESLQQTSRALGDAFDRAAKKVRQQPLIEHPGPPQVEPGIHMSFPDSGDEEFEALLEGGMATERKPPKG